LIFAFFIMYKQVLFASILFFAYGFIVSAPAYAAPKNFDPSFIIGDEEILDYNALTLTQVQGLLNRKGSYLANYSTVNPDGKQMTAAEIIYDRALANKVNPKFLLVLLQKEQGLIENDSPTPRQLDWACGYGCPDGSACNPRWQGLWKQINSASLQFRDYMDNPHLYTYKKGETYLFTNPYGTISKEPIKVTPYNQATAALYNYTPHVYNGNFNFHKIWNRYFYTKLLPEGTLLQVKGEPGVWLIQNGTKRAFTSRGALTSRYDVNKIITANASDLANYEKGNPIKFPQYSVVRSPKGTIYLLVDDTKRGFLTGEAFRKVGINPEELMDVSWDDLAFYSEGSPITGSTTYATGALLQDKKTGGIFFVMDSKKSPIWDRILLKTKYKGKSIVPADPKALAAFPTIEPARWDDGELLKSNSSSAVYVISEGAKRPFSSGEAFEQIGYKWKNVLTVPDKLLDLYPVGDPVSIEPPEVIEDTISTPATTTLTATTT
jgi:hypothetical protein